MASSGVRASSWFFVLCAVCCVLCAAVYAQVPRLIRYQGQAVDGNGVPLEGPYTLTFRLYDAATTGVKVWEESQANVALSKGHFSILLGSATPLDPVDWSKDLWLSIQVGTEAELSPRQRLTSVPLALRAETAERLAGSSSASSVRVYNSANISVANGSMPALTFDSERWDPDGLHDPANPSRLTAKTAGTYLIMGSVEWANNTAGVRVLRMLLNGSVVPASTGLSGDAYELQVATLYQLAAGDYVQLLVYQNSGSALNIVTSTRQTSPEFIMMKVD